MKVKKKIFITEDEFIVKKNLESKLTALGYDVIGSAVSGELTIEKIRKEQPDLILMDIMLAGKMDGIETASLIRSEYDIPIIFLTAYSSKEIYKRATITQPYAYIIKPFDERELEINIAIAFYKYEMESKLLNKHQELELLNNNLDKLVDQRTEKLILETDKKHKAENLQQRFFNIIEQTHDHVIITNIQGEIEYVNPAIKKFTGYGQKEFIGNKPSILQSGIYDLDYFSNIWSTVSQGQSYSDNVINKKKNGDFYISNMTIIPLKNKNNEITHYASIAKDSTKEKQFEKRLIDIQEEERERISKELHDGIGQSITAIKLGISAISNENKLNLNELNAQVNGLTNTIREASYNLMPSTLKDYGIISAINKMIMTFAENSKLTIDFSYPEEVYRLRNDIELALFRITQEAISNCIKHSNSKSLFIRLAYDPNFIILEIKDNGKGFNIELGNNENGQGLLNMKHRALILNGTFQIHSKINSGTIVKIKIPNEK